ncbi:MAG: hypothetical protein E7595_03645 [Ruminococcaceae bacterium]|nr:hypothetical protein [Oscillospiraceae bacterium]
MKKILCFVLGMLMLVSFAACGGEEEVAESSAEESVEIIPKVPVINGKEISEYTIVYKTTTGSCTYKDVAKGFEKYIEDTFGIDLVCRDETLPEAEYEIIFGEVSKRDIVEENKSDYGIGGYKVVIKGTKIYIASSYANGCNAGCEAFIEKIKTSEDGMFADGEFSGEKKIIKVACVGDSITQGINSTDPKNKTYPVYIQEMLGFDYYVLNAGLSGYSICKIDEYAYFKTSQYLQARELRPDVVLFALGTNDANPTPNQPYKNWDDPQYDRENVFIESTNELLDAFVKINPDVQIYMILPASLFKVGADGWSAEAWTKNIVEHSHPLLKKIATERNLPIVDLFPWSLENKEVFTDGLHPKDETYKTFAQFIYDSIKDTIKKPE